MRVVTPDVSLWKYIRGLIDALGGFQAGVLVAAVFGLLIGACLWAWGASSGNGGISAWGKRAIAGALGCAFCATAIPKMIALTIAQMSS
ncbi:hypothetical protein [Actinomyces naeslundii]